MAKSSNGNGNGNGHESIELNIRGAGAPLKPMVLPRGKRRFTIAELAEANPNIKATLTIRKRAERLVNSGVLVKHGTLRTVAEGMPGAPAKVYWRGAAFRALKTSKRLVVKNDKEPAVLA